MICIGAFGELELAEDHGSSVGKALHDRGVFRWNVIAVNRHAAGSRSLGCPAKILDRQRDAVQRAFDLTAANFGLRLFCLRHGGVSHHGRVALEFRIERRDSIEFSFRHFDRRQCARLNLSRHIQQSEEGKIGQEKPSPSRERLRRSTKRADRRTSRSQQPAEGAQRRGWRIFSAR